MHKGKANVKGKTKQQNPNLFDSFKKLINYFFYNPDFIIYLAVLKAFIPIDQHLPQLKKWAPTKTKFSKICVSLFVLSKQYILFILSIKLRSLGGLGKMVFSDFCF